MEEDDDNQDDQQDVRGEADHIGEVKVEEIRHQQQPIIQLMQPEAAMVVASGSARGALPSDFDLSRASQEHPRLDAHIESDQERAAVSLLEGMAPDRRHAVFRLGNRLALLRERREDFAGTKRGHQLAMAQAGLSDKLDDGSYLIVAVKGSPYLGLIQSIEVWQLIGQEWQGYVWTKRRRIFVRERFGADHPLPDDLRAQGYEIGKATVPDRMLWGLGWQVTTADHALHDIGARGLFTIFVRGFKRKLARKTIGGRMLNHLEGWGLKKWAGGAILVLIGLLAWGLIAAADWIRQLIW